MNKTNGENIREKLEYLNRTQDFNPTNIEWLMRQAERLQERVTVFEMKYENTGSIFGRSNLMNRIESAEAVLDYYAASQTYELQKDDNSHLYIDIEKDKGRRARTYLGRESNEDKKNKGAARNR